MIYLQKVVEPHGNDVFLLANALMPSLPEESQLCTNVPGVLNLIEFEGYSPCQLYDALCCLAVLSTVALVVMIVARFASDYIWPEYQKVSPSHKKWYVIGNLMKSGCLACLTFSPFWRSFLYHGFVSNNWEMSLPCIFYMKRTVVVYVVMDVVTLFTVPKMPTTTVIHHILSLLLCTCIFAVDPRTGDIIRMIGMYGAWSALSYLVNTYLALRVVTSKAYVNFTAILALWIYIGVCAANWSLHVYWLHQHYNVSNRRGGLSRYSHFDRTEACTLDMCCMRQRSSL